LFFFSFLFLFLPTPLPLLFFFLFLERERRHAGEIFPRLGKCARLFFLFFFFWADLPCRIKLKNVFHAFKKIEQTALARVKTKKGIPLVGRAGGGTLQRFFSAICLWEKKKEKKKERKYGKPGFYRIITLAGCTI